MNLVSLNVAWLATTCLQRYWYSLVRTLAMLTLTSYVNAILKTALLLVEHAAFVALRNRWLTTLTLIVC